MSDDNASAGNQGGDALTGNEPPTDLGLGGNESLRTGAASDQSAAAPDGAADPAAMSSMETPDAENPNLDEDSGSEADPDGGKLKDGTPSAAWLPESSPPTTSGPVP